MAKRWTSLFLFLCLTASVTSLPVHAFDAKQAPLPISAQGSLQVAFSPWDNVEGLIIETIESAKKQILVQAYAFTSKKIATALILAHQRGVDVRILVDGKLARQNKSSKAAMLAEAGIPVWLETKYQNAHNKTMVLDAGTPHAAVITGSYNFSWSAQHKNAENILIIRQNAPLTSRYAANWERHKQDATPYK